MKIKRITALALAFVMVLGMAIPMALAEDPYADMHGTPYPQTGYYYTLSPMVDGIGMYRNGADNFYYMHTTKGTIDLRDRYKWTGTFSEGLAAVAVDRHEENRHEKVGYIDTEFNEVIPPNDEWTTWEPFFDYGDRNFSGSFRNGKALVIRRFEDDEVPKAFFSKKGITFSNNFGIYYNYIDRWGDYLGEWIFEDDIDKIAMLPLYDNFGVWIGDCPEIAQRREQGLGAWGKEYTDMSSITHPLPQAPELPDYNYEAPSLFASNAKITGYHVSDFAYGTVYVDITNPEDVTDAGVIAIVLVNTHSTWNRACCCFIPYELEAGETRTFYSMVTEIVDLKIGGGMDSYIPYSEQIAAGVESAIITFEDDADMWEFYDMIPYEQNWRTGVAGFTREEERSICDAEAGNEWLAMLGIPRLAPRLDEILYYSVGITTIGGDGYDVFASDVSHDRCVR